MSKKSNYISTNRSKHYLKCHLIFVCKYRKKLLVGQLKDDMRSILLNITLSNALIKPIENKYWTHTCLKIWMM